MVEELGIHYLRHLGLGANAEMQCPRAFLGGLCIETLFFCVKDRPGRGGCQNFFAFCCGCIWTWVLKKFFLCMAPLTYGGGPRCQL